MVLVEAIDARFAEDELEARQEAEEDDVEDDEVEGEEVGNGLGQEKLDGDEDAAD